MFFAVHCLVLASLAAVATAGCKNTFNNRECIKKADAPGWMQGFYTDGDPCFTYSDTKFCFYASGALGSCNCDIADCGCGDAPPKEPDPCEGYPTPDSYCDLCDDYSQFNTEKTKHTMCDSKLCSLNKAKCDRVCYRGADKFSAADKQVIVDRHNELRARVARGEESLGVGNIGQPGASDMMELVWDDDLAKVAQAWADQCTGGHDKVRETKDFPSWVGQNYAMTAASWYKKSNDLKEMVDMWYGEVKDMPASTVGGFTNAGATGVIGHYTQVVWAKSTKVGCGFIKFHANGWFSQELVCNYGPGGNWSGEPLYNAEGSPGENCPNGAYGPEAGFKEGLCVNPDA